MEAKGPAFSMATHSSTEEGGSGGHGDPGPGRVAVLGLALPKTGPVPSVDATSWMGPIEPTRMGVKGGWAHGICACAKVNRLLQIFKNFLGIC